MRVTTYRVKCQLIDAAMQLLQRAGMTVTADGLNTPLVHLHISVPPDSTDPHGARLADCQ